MSDLVNNPPHYNSHPSGVECIEITEHMNFNLGNAIKYIWRAGLKGDAVEDLKKAAFYIGREIERISPQPCTDAENQEDIICEKCGVSLEIWWNTSSGNFCQTCYNYGVRKG